ncbi:small ribosomal subunit Rsm22 family protein [Fodinicurvata sp. EGI_FJ10296]|uniref:small ribosomal subunit Rsm22 family protein n=1 Tax=Fodinicurvata sp. EGI_FJ10296 TaxID=3231908 RepID=UPI003453FAAB
MMAPLALPEPVAEALGRMLDPARTGQGAGQGAMIERYRNRREPGAAGLVSDAERRAYLRHRFPATFAAVSAALATMPPALAAGIADAVDLGAGTGASAAAAAVRLPGLTAMTIIDSDRAALALAEPLVAAANPDLAVTTRTADAAAGLARVHSGGADLVMASYLLNELPGDRADTVTDAMWHSARRAVLIVEPGSRVGFAALIRARQRLIDLGARLLAPCPHVRACPMGEPGQGDDWCHFPLGYDDPFEDQQGRSTEKISFVLAILPSDETDADGIASPADNRIVKAPMRRTGHVVLDLCTRSGTLERRTVTRRQGKDYKAARAADWGDAWPDTQAGDLSGGPSDTEGDPS